MAFFEELGEKISKGSQDAVQKTKDMANVVNLTNENSNIDKRIANTKNQIGISVYEAIFEKMTVEDITNATSPVAISETLWTSLCQMAADIKNNEKTKFENSEKIRDLKGERLCPKCGKLIPKGGVFCTGCGEKIAVVEEPQSAPSSVKICPNCGKQLSEDAVFCTGCGTKVSE